MHFATSTKLRVFLSFSFKKNVAPLSNRTQTTKGSVSYQKFENCNKWQVLFSRKIIRLVKYDNSNSTTIFLTSQQVVCSRRTCNKLWHHHVHLGFRIKASDRHPVICLLRAPHPSFSDTLRVSPVYRNISIRNTFQPVIVLSLEDVNLFVDPCCRCVDVFYLSPISSNPLHVTAS